MCNTSAEGNKRLTDCGVFVLKRVYCGHEYTVSNLKFARHVEPDNDVIKKKLAWAKVRRWSVSPQSVKNLLTCEFVFMQEKCKNGEPTIPSTLADEFTFNPFMRVKYVQLGV